LREGGGSQFTFPVREKAERDADKGEKKKQSHVRPARLPEGPYGEEERGGIITDRDDYRKMKKVQERLLKGGEGDGIKKKGGRTCRA